MLSSQPYDAGPLQHALAQRADWNDMGKSYVSSVEYFYDVLASYLRERASDDSTFIVLGDHQPAANVSGAGAPWDVPVHIISKRRDVLERLHRRGFSSGLMPTRPALGKMNELALWVLDAFDRAARPPPQPLRSDLGSSAQSDSLRGN
jgi:hypothetical protein